jgi:hypothetical protein
MEINKQKSFKPKMTGRKLGSGVNLYGASKPNGLKLA